jgi:gliding motility-associated-like protein
MAYSGNACSSQYFQDIVVNAAPVAQLAPIPPVCQDSIPFILTQGAETTGLAGLGVYSGAGIALSPLFSPSAAGQGQHIIRYTFTGVNGCSSYDEKTIEVFPTPLINAGPDLKVLEGDAVILQPSQASNNLTFLWLPSTYLDDASKANPLCRPTNDITYTIRVTSADGCTATDDLFIKVIRDFIVPNTFTPNNDGINDYWLIDNLYLYPSHRVQVFNRYGQLVFETANYSSPWDGTYKGKNLPVGTYYYIIELGGQRKPKTGYVTIIK